MTGNLRLVVCGTAFGQVYLEALRAAALPYDLVGVVGRGSARSAACARHYGVPLITDPDRVDADVACVVVRGGLLGGAGTDLAVRLMDRGVHVLQEHPIHRAELAGCLRAARRNRVVYHLTSFYPELPPVRRFLAGVAGLLALRRPVHVDAICGFQVAYALLDIVGAALGRLRPYSFRAAPAGRSPGPFRSLDGEIGGVPVSLRVQHLLDPGDPDAHPHLLHRISVATDSGQLTLVTTAGPVVWSDRPRIPRAGADPASGPLFATGGLGGDEPAAVVLGPPAAPGHQEVFARLWPLGAAGALRRMHAAVTAGEDPARRGQYHLTLCQMWQDIAALLGPPDLTPLTPPPPLTPGELETVAKAVRG
ncbi:Gfo/Idh/MocA family oxidoreductase [Bailinhaonella thermotolerans]|uniref:Thiazolinyl imide reductase n=1 Tax=Bailinhaonella thermotolerans TaxID=1070861 RepID=A0A3A4AFT4_9ACTN|nr:Gfo/Idh/MocA family oxidoreductase [Bailinhaonella thermotolerans]RJL27209.1 thiazolinyl imide reductase [Bailinhaonella thermotolerans]